MVHVIKDDPDRTSALSRMRAVLLTEASALRDMSEMLDDAHVAAVGILLNVKGRIVVSGVGKSGHVARKIAATFASTGAPAQFVHLTEASHGDLGMITQQDAVIGISNSGESREMNNLIGYTRRFGIPLIAVTGKKNSTLGMQADIVLPLPTLPEACMIGKAPTTSTTATMALGDALAIALMEARGIGPDEYHVYHPGGQLGAQLIKVDQIMHIGDAIPQVRPDTPMEQVLLEMTTKSLGVTAVTQMGDLLGVITDGDLRRNMIGLLGKQAGDIATSFPKTIPSGILAVEALKFMQDQKISVVFVVSNDVDLVGILRLTDCLQAGVA